MSVTVKNTGERAGDEVVQIYVTRRGGERHAHREAAARLRAGHAQRRASRRRSTFTLGPADLGLYDRGFKWVVEPGEFRVTAGTSSDGGLQASFEVTKTGH